MSADKPRLDLNGIALLGLLLGLLTGFLEVAARLAGQLAWRADPLVSAHFVWMTPLAVTTLFSLAILPLLVFAARRPLPALPVLAMVLFLAALGPLLALGWLARWAQVLAALGIAAQGARLLAPRTDVLTRRAARAVPALALLVVVLAAGMVGKEVLLERRGLAALRSARAGAPNVLLIILDTARAASMSLYGHAHRTTPNLDRFAARGVVFEHAWAASPWTLPSHASLFTGRYAAELSTDLVTPLDDSFPTLAEHFRNRGYHTAGFSANIRYANHAMGVTRGFLRYEDYPINPAMIANSSVLTRRLATRLLRLAGVDQKLVRKPARAITERFLAWRRAHDDRPFFAFLNYFDAHAPYLPPDSLAGRFGPRRRGRAMHDLSNVEHWSAEDIAAERAAYEESLASADHQLGVLFDAIEESGLLDNTVVLVTSDHGEQFGEHGLMDHGNSLYVPLLEVPLVVHYPDLVPAGVRIKTPVSLRDVAITLADLADAEPAPFPGTSLASLWSDDPATPSPIYSEVREGIRPVPWLPLAKGSLASVLQGNFHYIVNGDGTEEFYDLSRDPDELIDLSDSSRAQIALQAARTTLSRLRADGGRHAGR